MGWDVVIGFIGGLSGSIIAAVSQYKNNKLNQKFELEKVKQTQLLDIGFKDYEMKVQTNDKLIEQGKDVNVLTLEMHLFFHKKYMEFLEKENITEDDVSEYLKAMEQFRFHFETHYELYGKK